MASSRNEIVEGRPIRCYYNIHRQESTVLYMSFPQRPGDRQTTYDAVVWHPIRGFLNTTAQPGSHLGMRVKFATLPGALLSEIAQSLGVVT